jgi:hypothetical protein
MLLLVGVILVIDGMYAEEIETLKKTKKIEYKIVPRAMYDDLLFVQGTKQGYANMFDDEFEFRGVGRY